MSLYGGRQSLHRLQGWPHTKFHLIVTCADCWIIWPLWRHPVDWWHWHDRCETLEDYERAAGVFKVFKCNELNEGNRFTRLMFNIHFSWSPCFYFSAVWASPHSLPFLALRLPVSSRQGVYDANGHNFGQLRVRAFSRLSGRSSPQSWSSLLQNTRLTMQRCKSASTSDVL